MPTKLTSEPHDPFMLEDLWLHPPVAETTVSCRAPRKAAWRYLFKMTETIWSSSFIEENTSRLKIHVVQSIRKARVLVI